jgi:hypothetical protein
MFAKAPTLAIILTVKNLRTLITHSLLFLSVPPGVFSPALCEPETQVARSLSNLSRLGLVLKSKNQHCNTLGPHQSQKTIFLH